jgi:DNA polymerase III subunit delta
MTVYLLLGDDEERKFRGVEKLGAGRTVQAYDASEIRPETLVSACNSFSLFGEGHFVVLKNLDAWNAAQKAVIVDYLEDPSPGSDLILLGKKLGARERLLSAVKNSGEVHTFDQPTGKALVSWLVGHAQMMDLDLPEDVAEDLASRCSGDKMRLLQETEKLALYVGDGTATHDDVAALCPPDVQSNVFAFVDSLAAGERDRALALLEDLMGTGEPPLRLTFMIRRQFQLVARARALLHRGTSHKELSSRLKVPPFVARKLEEQSRKLDEEDLERAMAQIQDLEGGLKGGSYLSDELQVEMTVLGLSERSA